MQELKLANQDSGLAAAKGQILQLTRQLADTQQKLSSAQVALQSQLGKSGSLNISFGKGNDSSISAANQVIEDLSSDLALYTQDYDKIKGDLYLQKKNVSDLNDSIVKADHDNQVLSARIAELEQAQDATAVQVQTSQIRELGYQDMIEQLNTELSTAEKQTQAEHSCKEYFERMIRAMDRILFTVLTAEQVDECHRRIDLWCAKDKEDEESDRSSVGPQYAAAQAEEDVNAGGKAVEEAGALIDERTKSSTDETAAGEDASAAKKEKKGKKVKKKKRTQKVSSLEELWGAYGM